MYRSIMLAAAVGVSMAVPVAAHADVPLPKNLYMCNGVVVAAGDHPLGAPAFVAKLYGVPVNVLLAQTRQDFSCSHP